MFADPLALHGYLLLAVLAILEGPLLAIACGVAAGLGWVDPPLAYGILIAGDFLPDVFYYALGRYGASMPRVRLAASRIRLLRKNLPALEHLWRVETLATMASAKLAYGIAPPLIVAAGLAKVPFGRFARDSLIVSSIYLGLLGVAGFGFARAYGYVDIATGEAPLFISLAGALSLSILGVAMHRARRRLTAAPRSEYGPVPLEEHLAGAHSSAPR